MYFSQLYNGIDMFYTLSFQYEIPVKTLKGVETRFIKKHSYWCVSISYHELHVYDKNDKRAFKNLCPIPLFSNNKICSHQKQDSKSLGRNRQTTQARYHLELTFYDFKGIHCGMFNELLDSVLSTLSYWRLSSFFRFFYSLSCLIGFFFFKSQ